MAVDTDGIIKRFHAPLEEATLFASFQAVIEALVLHVRKGGVYPTDGYTLVKVHEVPTPTRTLGEVVA